jgi:hypothetical protein
VRLTYFHANRLLTELYKQETEISLRKDDGNIKKKTDIDRHGPKASSHSSQPPEPLHFSLTTTFKFNIKILTNFLTENVKKKLHEKIQQISLKPLDSI